MKEMIKKIATFMTIVCGMGMMSGVRAEDPIKVTIGMMSMVVGDTVMVPVRYSSSYYTDFFNVAVEYDSTKLELIHFMPGETACNGEDIVENLHPPFNPMCQSGSSWNWAVANQSGGTNCVGQNKMLMYLKFKALATGNHAVKWSCECQIPDPPYLYRWFMETPTHPDYLHWCYGRAISEDGVVSVTTSNGGGCRPPCELTEKPNDVAVQRQSWTVIKSLYR